jgi:hypothetical protein
MTVFDRPQFGLLPDLAGPRQYGNVDNRMEVHTRAGTWHVALAVPTGLFLLMKGVLSVSVDDAVSLSLDEGDDERYVFSLMVGTERLYDLWSYSTGSVPRWVFNPEYRIAG